MLSQTPFRAALAAVALMPCHVLGTSYPAPGSPPPGFPAPGFPCVAEEAVLSALNAGSSATAFCSSFLHIVPTTSTKTVSATASTSTALPVTVTLTVTGGVVGGTVTISAPGDTSTVVSTITNTNNLCLQPSVTVARRHVTTTSSTSSHATTTSKTSTTTPSWNTNPGPGLALCSSAASGLKGFACSAISQACSCLSITRPTIVVTASTTVSTAVSTVTSLSIITTAIPATITVTPSVSTSTSVTTAVISTCLCGSPFTACSAQCVDTQTDPLNCGGCGSVCDYGLCTNGQCSCPGTMCGSQCIDTQSDPQNCGTCGNVCASGVCDASTCACSGTVCGGQCIDTQNDPLNCGLCGFKCASGICSDSRCQCAPGGDVDNDNCKNPQKSSSCGYAGHCTCYATSSGDAVCAGAPFEDTCSECESDSDCTARGQGYCVDQCRPAFDVKRQLRGEKGAGRS
ncbi:hypothetical protein QBC47DRAFT_404126 [Echria macrotheca]|uniref:Uncharacterized protein n=1 Tax=Echria macrotheca TaxID=438768 RepID=A0AAJ0BAK7_9PEZI|nr:hypothetical protein QBC47DRAFT_404126 [Echria macrotheca]